MKISEETIKLAEEIVAEMDKERLLNAEVDATLTKTVYFKLKETGPVRSFFVDARTLFPVEQMPLPSKVFFANGTVISIDCNIKVSKNGEGMTCSKCNVYNEYAEANQGDGGFKCWSCRQG